MAEFAANAAQGHIGRARYLATNEEARKTREKILSIPFTVKDLASAFEAANTLVELAKSQALAESEFRDREELSKLKEFYGTTGSKLATGGSKAIKEYEKSIKYKEVRRTKDFINWFYQELNTQKNQELYTSKNLFISSLINKYLSSDQQKNLMLSTESLMCALFLNMHDPIQMPENRLK